MMLRQFFKKNFDFVIQAAGSPIANYLMMLYSALESILLPVPVDPILAAIVLAKPDKWLRSAVCCTIASVVGGAVGWALGSFLGPHVQDLMLNLPMDLVPPSAFNNVKLGFEEFGLALVFLGAFSPLPYKVISVSAGIGGFSLWTFLLMSLLGRGLRFTIIAAIAKHHGDAKKIIVLTSILVTLVSGAIWLTK